MFYEYQAHRLNCDDPAEMQSTLNQYSADGWRLVSTAPSLALSTILIFERPVERVAAGAARTGFEPAAAARRH